MSILYVDPKDSKEFWGKIERSPCCDHVIISMSEIQKIEKLFHLKINETVPSDLFFCGTIPLQNLKITITDFFEDVGADAYIHIFDFYNKPFPNDEYLSVGAIQLTKDEYALIDIKNESNVVYTGLFGFNHSSEETFKKAIKNHFKKKIDSSFENDLYHYIGLFMKTFYLIQIAMLNPTTKELFKSPKPSCISEKNYKSKKNKKRKIKYIKKYYITEENIESAINEKYSSGSKKIYSCLLWYVCGHWREYKNGKKIFIKPYWKGEMRNKPQYVKNIERQRIIHQIKEVEE